MSDIDSILSLFELTDAEKRDLPVAELSDDFCSIQRHYSYSAIERFEVKLEEELPVQDARIQECVARLVLVDALEKDQWQPTCVVPDSVRAEVEVQFRRIREAVVSKPIGYYQPGRDNFRKDAGLVRGALLPVGAGVIDTDSFVWRRPLKVGTLRQRWRFISFYLRSPRGLKPVFQAHTHTEMLNKFNETGWRDAYRLVANLLNHNPHYKGFVRASWFCDPEVASVSPRLAYITQEPTHAGALLCYLGEDQSGLALSKSATRRKLFEEGTYVPRSYLLIWHREDMLAWLRNLK